MSVITVDEAVDVFAQFVMMKYGKVTTEEIGQLLSILEKKALAHCPKDDPDNRLHGLIKDINPEEIAEHIKVDSLIDWCEQIQVEMELALVQIGRTGDIKINGTST